MRTLDHSPGVEIVEFLHVDSEPLRLAAHLVQRGQRVVAIKGRVLHSFRCHRPGQLLEPQYEIAPRVPLLAGQSGGVFEEHELAYEIEGRRAGGRVAPFGFADGYEDVAAVLLANLRLFLAYVAAINRKAGDDFAERVLQAVEREIARESALFRNAIQPARQHMQLAGHRHAQNELLALVDQVGEVRRFAREAFVKPAHPRFVGAFDKNAVELIEKSVAGRPVGRPVQAHQFALAEDLLDYDIEGLAAVCRAIRQGAGIGRMRRHCSRSRSQTCGLQIAEVKYRIEQPVHMINP